MASIVKRKNRYCLVYNFTDKGGERKQKWETFKTMAEAKIRQKEVEYKEKNGTLIIPQCKNLQELFQEYVAVYGKTKWSMSTYSSNISLLENYVYPLLGSLKLNEVTPRVLERYYQKLLTMKAVARYNQKNDDRLIGTATVRDIHKLLRSGLNQAVKWEMIEKNPALLATVPKHEQETREIWTMETLAEAMRVCKDERLKLAINLSFSCSLREGECLGLTWDCVDISEESIRDGSASVTVNKTLQRVNKASLAALENKDIILEFPAKSTLAKSVLVLKAPKTYSSVRKVFLPHTVAEMLAAWKKEQEELKETLGSEYQDYNLVLAGPIGLPTEVNTLNDAFQRLIRDHNLPKVVFHSLRHSSITFKLKLNGGDVKSVQGDSGHAQATMVTEVYSHILDDDRKKNAQLLEESFYSGNGLPDTETGRAKAEKKEGPSDMETIMRLLAKPETAGLLKALVNAMGN